MRKIFLLASLIIIIITLASCSWLTSPEELKPGRRNYVWQEDTIKVPEGYYTNMARIWGNDPNDVWICGISYISDHTIWHYDGTEWTNIDMSRFITPFAVYGFAHNDVWIGTLESNIWHWNGNELLLYGNYTLPNYDDINIQNIWGANSSEVFAVGCGINAATSEMVGIIMKYNGVDWTFNQIYEERLTFLDIRKQESSGLYFINSHIYGRPDMPYILFALRDYDISIIQESEYYISIHEINGEIYFSKNRQIFKYKNNALVVWKDFSNTQYLARIWGRNESDFFTVNSNGLGHYDGNDLITLYETEYRIENIQLFEKDIFILCYDRESNQNIIIMGKLN